MAIPTGLVDAAATVNRAVVRHRARHGTEPTDAELAAATGKTVEKVRDVIDAAAVRFESTEAPVFVDDSAG
jgi:DNA-directed RNA polymerase specialized sigma subunit